MTRRIVNLLLVFFGSLLVFGFAGLMWIARLQASFLVFPAKSLPQMTPGDVGITDYEDITLTTADGLMLQAWYVPPPGATPGPAVIFTHGIVSNRQHWLPELQTIHREGYGAILFTFRNHGESEGDVTTLGLQEVEDVRAALNHLLAQPEVDNERIAIVGDSLGGSTALMAAAQLPEIQGVVAISPYSSLLGVIGDRAGTDFRLPARPTADLVLWFANRMSGEDLYNVDPLEAAQQVAPRPMWLIHGGDDRTTPAVNTERIAAALEAMDAPNVEVWIEPGIGHGAVRMTHRDEFQAGLLDFLNETIGEPVGE